MVDKKILVFKLNFESVILLENSGTKDSKSRRENESWDLLQGIYQELLGLTQ